MKETFINGDTDVANARGPDDQIIVKDLCVELWQDLISLSKIVAVARLS